MKVVCPYCDWPEFAPEPDVQIEQASRGWLGWLFRKTGKLVRCARCTRQYAIGESGAYKITPERAHVEVGPPKPADPPNLGLIDADQAEAWK